jgi:hypothetical protein
MGLSTLDITIPGSGSNNSNNNGGGYKGLNPGNYKVKVHRFELWDQPFAPEEKGLFLVMKMESAKPSPDFEGYPVDENNPDGPKYEGLIGNVRTSAFAFKDGYNAKKNVPVVRDRAILEELLRLCTEFDCVQWFKDAHGKYGTIHEWVDAFNEAAPFKDKYLEVCIAVKEYMGKDGKVKRPLAIAPYEKVDGKYHNGYKALTSQKTVVKFDADKHWKKVNPEPVSEFKADDQPDDAAFESITKFDKDGDEMPFDLDAGFDI